MASASSCTRSRHRFLQTMPRLQHHKFVIRVGHKRHDWRPRLAAKLNEWPAKLMTGFRKIILQLLSIPATPQRASLQTAIGNAEVPKRSCSFDLQPVNSHYDEAITDCIEFFNKSSQVTRPTA